MRVLNCNKMTKYVARILKPANNIPKFKGMTLPADIPNDRAFILRWSFRLTAIASSV